MKTRKAKPSKPVKASVIAKKIAELRKREAAEAAKLQAEADERLRLLALKELEADRLAKAAKRKGAKRAALAAEMSDLYPRIELHVPGLDKIVTVNLADVTDPVKRGTAVESVKRLAWIAADRWVARFEGSMNAGRIVPASNFIPALLDADDGLRAAHKLGLVAVSDQ